MADIRLLDSLRSLSFEELGYDWAYNFDTDIKKKRKKTYCNIV